MQAFYNRLVRSGFTKFMHQMYRSCVGIKSLVKRYTPERIEAASERALVAGARSYLNVESILRNGLDRQPLAVTTASGEAPPLDHENIRGADC